MKNKTLMIVLAVICALLVFEAGYLAGVGEQRALRRMWMNRYRNFQPRYTPLVRNVPREMAGMQQKVIRQKSRSFFVAAMTSKETETASIITVNLPGLKKEEIGIEVKSGYLIIHAGQKTAKGEEELNAANFIQRVALPRNARAQQISAEFHKDTLVITIPKDKRSRRISEAAMNIPIK